VQPCTSASFSAANVGPKSAYRSRTSDNARSQRFRLFFRQPSDAVFFELAGLVSYSFIC
jgi:hypothetical protein